MGYSVFSVILQTNRYGKAFYFSTMERIRQQYLDRTETLSRQLLQCKKRGRLLVVAQLVFFILALLSVVAFTTLSGGGWWLLLTLLLLLLYGVARRMDVANSDKTEQVANLRQAYQHEVAYLQGDFSVFEDGSAYLDAHHPYSFDLDVFGPQSLFQRINRTITTGGSDWLARQLSQSDVPCREQILRQRQAITELAGQEELRMRFIAIGQSSEKHIDTHSVMLALQQVRAMRLPSLIQHPMVRMAALIAVAGFVLAFVASWADWIPSAIPTYWALAQLLLMVCCCSKPLRTVKKSVGIISRQMKAYVSLMEIISQAPLQSPDHKAILAQLSTGDTNALGSFAELKRFIEALDRNGNELYRQLANAFFLNDFFLVYRFMRWQGMRHIDEWIDAVSHFDALVSMATFCHNEPHAIQAELIDTDAVVYRAEGLYHPFLGQKAVRNDFTIEDSHYYIITGANMAGKSTFLRSLGVNYILALAGMPVFAGRLQLSLFSLFSSMRTSDDLAHGISYFNAELLRLQQLIGCCRSNRRTLIILDEILKGTNSADKLNGSRMFLEAISKLSVTGIIATHDLELSKMADAYPSRFHNYCFEIALSTRVTYSYRITPGVARNQNATFLLQQILR